MAGRVSLLQFVCGRVSECMSDKTAPRVAVVLISSPPTSTKTTHSVSCSSPGLKETQTQTDMGEKETWKHVVFLLWTNRLHHIPSNFTPCPQQKRYTTGPKELHTALRLHQRSHLIDWMMNPTNAKSNIEQSILFGNITKEWKIPFKFFFWPFGSKNSSWLISTLLSYWFVLMRKPNF